MFGFTNMHNVARPQVQKENGASIANGTGSAGFSGPCLHLRPRPEKLSAPKKASLVEQMFPSTVRILL